MGTLGLRTYPPHDYESWERRVQNMLDLWEIWFPEARCFTISQVGIISMRSFKIFASAIQHGWQIPRELPIGMPYTEDTIYYQKSFYKIWEPEIDHAEFQSRFLAWYTENATGVGVFLETWVDEAKHEDIAEIAEAISSLRNKYGSIKSFSNMDNTRLGNLIACLIRKCGHSRRGMEAAGHFLNIMLDLVGRQKTSPIFDAVARRLHKHDLIISLYLFSRAIPILTPKKERQDLISDLIAAVDRELRKIEYSGLAKPDMLGVPSVRSCFEIVLFLESHADYWEASDDMALFYHLTEVAEQAIGSVYRQLWCSIGKEKMYDQAKIKQCYGSWAWYCRYPNHRYRGHFLLGGFLTGVLAAAYCMLLRDGTARYLLLLSPCVSASVLWGVVFNKLYLERCISSN
jgi:hypothetical protein